MLVLLTDDERLTDPIAAARKLPRGAMIIVRSRDHARRDKLAREMVELSRSRGLIVLVANDARLAMICDADGLHLSQANASQAAHWRAVRPNWFISIAAHDLRSAVLSKYADAVLLSPVFPTASHFGATALTPVRANLMANALTVPAYALGGVTSHTALRLKGFAGIAAIGALAP